MNLKQIETDFCGGNHWRLGNYKIVQYEYITRGGLTEKFKHSETAEKEIGR